MTENEDNINEDDIHLFKGDDFVFTKNSNGEIVGGGYKVKSFFLDNDFSLHDDNSNETDQDKNIKGGQHTSSYENLAIPAGLFYINTKIKKRDKENNEYKEHKMIPDDLLDHLFGLVEADKKSKRKTRRTNKKEKINRKTRKSN